MYGPVDFYDVKRDWGRGGEVDREGGGRGTLQSTSTTAMALIYLLYLKTCSL